MVCPFPGMAPGFFDLAAPKNPHHIQLLSQLALLVFVIMLGTAYLFWRGLRFVAPLRRKRYVARVCIIYLGYILPAFAFFFLCDLWGEALEEWYGLYELMPSCYQPGSYAHYKQVMAAYNQLNTWAIILVMLSVAFMVLFLYRGIALNRGLSR